MHPTKQEVHPTFRPVHPTCRIVSKWPTFSTSEQARTIGTEYSSKRYEKIIYNVKLFDKVKWKCYTATTGGETMKEYTGSEFERLQDNLALIRKAGGWSAEEFGDMIGVTKQTISNLENKKTPLSKTQYIAIRAVLDYEIAERAEHGDDTVLASTVNLCLNSEGLSDDEIKKAQAFVEGATRTGLDKAATAAGLVALIGAAAAEAIFVPFVGPLVTGSTLWIAKLLKKKK